jgi:hypothetical protein
MKLQIDSEQCIEKFEDGSDPEGIYGTILLLEWQDWVEPR